MKVLGTVTIRLHLTTGVGGPITLGTAEVDVPVTAVADGASARLIIDQRALRAEIADALVGVASKIREEG